MNQDKNTTDIITILVLIAALWVMGAIFFGGENWLFPK